MASTNKTTHYELSQYVSSDKPTYLIDYNGDMAKIDTGINAAKTTADTASTAATNAQTAAEGAQTTANTAVTNAAAADTKATTANTNIGTMANLATVEKTNLVGAINEVLASITNKVYPVGSIYISTSNTNPQALFGGTWVSFGVGRTLVGYDATQTEFNAIEKTGGSKFLQEHDHVIAEDPTEYVMYWANGAGNQGTTTGGQLQGYDNKRTATAGTGDSGNLQPYIVVNMWKRVA